MGLEVIGAGFGRTGTMSAKLALEQLGFGPCHHMMEVFKQPESMGWWEAAADGAPDWPRIFEGFRSAVDWPSATFWRELAAFYPKAKVILTRRDSQAGFRSTQATIFHGDFAIGGGPFERMASKVIGALFDQRMHDQMRLTEVFERHCADVVASLPPERLLVWEVAEGWGPLCAFLGVAEPDGPMPKVNSSEEFWTARGLTPPPGAIMGSAPAQGVSAP